MSYVPSERFSNQHFSYTACIIADHLKALLEGQKSEEQYLPGALVNAREMFGRALEAAEDAMKPPSNPVLAISSLCELNKHLDAISDNSPNSRAELDQRLKKFSELTGLLEKITEIPPEQRSDFELLHALFDRIFRKGDEERYDEFMRGCNPR